MWLPVRLLFLHGYAPAESAVPRPRRTTRPREMRPILTAYGYRVCNNEPNPVVAKRTVNRERWKRSRRIVFFFFFLKTQRDGQKRKLKITNTVTERVNISLLRIVCVISKKKKTLTH